MVQFSPLPRLRLFCEEKTDEDQTIILLKNGDQIVSESDDQTTLVITYMLITESISITTHVGLRRKTNYYLNIHLYDEHSKFTQIDANREVIYGFEGVFDELTIS